MAKSKLLRQQLAFVHSYNRACYHPKHRVRVKNFRRAERIINRQCQVYGCVPIPPEWLYEDEQRGAFFMKNYT